MLKYHSTYIGFREIPDEISLCINISNCPNNCKGCHSPWLLENIGTYLYESELRKLISDNKGITCVCFMGGDAEPWEINYLGQIVNSLGLKLAWYSGKQDFYEHTEFKYFDYIKLGPYIPEKGPLDSPNTNQKLFKFTHKGNTNIIQDITNRFWNND